MIIREAGAESLNDFQMIFRAWGMIDIEPFEIIINDDRIIRR
jgi:hypothetical protein